MRQLFPGIIYLETAPYRGHLVHHIRARVTFSYPQSLYKRVFEKIHASIEECVRLDDLHLVNVVFKN